MMLCTLGVSAAFLFVPEVKAWVAVNPWTTWVAFLGFFGLMLAAGGNFLWLLFLVIVPLLPLFFAHTCLLARSPQRDATYTDVKRERKRKIETERQR
jgi:fatty acid desaturase